MFNVDAIMKLFMTKDGDYPENTEIQICPRIKKNICLFKGDLKDLPTIKEYIPTIEDYHVDYILRYTDQINDKQTQTITVVVF